MAPRHPGDGDWAKKIYGTGRFGRLLIA